MNTELYPIDNTARPILALAAGFGDAVAARVSQRFPTPDQAAAAQERRRS